MLAAIIGPLSEFSTYKALTVIRPWPNNGFSSQLSGPGLITAAQKHSAWLPIFQLQSPSLRKSRSNDKRKRLLPNRKRFSSQKKTKQKVTSNFTEKKMTTKCRSYTVKPKLGALTRIESCCKFLPQFSKWLLCIMPKMKVNLGVLIVLSVSGGPYRWKLRQWIYISLLTCLNTA